MGRNGSNSRMMHELSLWAQAVGGSLRDLRRRREMGMRPDKFGFRGDRFEAREPDYYEAHGYAPAASAPKARFRDRREPMTPSQRTALAVAAIIIGATVPAFTIVSMMNPSDPDAGFNSAAGEYATQRALAAADRSAMSDPAAAGLAADDSSAAWDDGLLPSDVTDLTGPEVSTETDDRTTMPGSQAPSESLQFEGPRVPEAPAALPSSEAPVAAPQAPQAPAPTRQAPSAPAEKPAAPDRTVRTKAPKVVSSPLAPAKPTRPEKPAKPQRSERDDRSDRQKSEKKAAPKTERGGKTLIDKGETPAAPEAPEAPKTPKTPKAPKAPDAPTTPTQPQPAPDQPAVSVDPADPEANPAADDGPETSTDRYAHGQSEGERRVSPRSVGKAPTVQSETEDPAADSSEGQGEGPGQE